MTSKLHLFLSQLHLSQVKPSCPVVSIFLILFEDLELVLSVQISVFLQYDTPSCYMVLLNNYG